MEGGFDGGGGGCGYGSGECPACLAEQRIGTSLQACVLLPPHVILLFIVPNKSNHDEQHPKMGRKASDKPERAKQKIKKHGEQ